MDRESPKVVTPSTMDIENFGHPDKPKEAPKWMCYEQIGAEVVLAPEGLTFEALDAINAKYRVGGAKKCLHEDAGNTKTPVDDTRTEPEIAMYERLANTGKYRIKTLNGIKVGDMVLAPSLFGYCLAEVGSVTPETKEAYATTGPDGTGFMLHFGGDDRNCWWCASSINLRALKRLKIFSEDHEDSKPVLDSKKVE